MFCLLEVHREWGSPLLTAVLCSFIFIFSCLFVLPTYWSLQGHATLFNCLSLCDRGTKTLVALSHAENILHGKANCAIKGFYQSVTYPSKCIVQCR